MSKLTAEERVYAYSFSDPPNAMVSNAVDQLHLYAVCDGNLPLGCAFKRTEGTGIPPDIMDYNQSVPTRPPSALPLPGNLALQLSVGLQIGRGRTSSVYDAAIDFRHSSPELAAFEIPPLVIKVSRPGREQAMDNEAFFYEEMESLQGIVIPRYYGFFKGELPAGYRLAGDDSAEIDRVDRGDSSGSEGVRCTESSDHDERERHSVCDKPDTSLHSDGSRLVSILVLEKLGGKIPVSQPLPLDIKQEIRDMYAHLSHLGIDHIDIRHANILEAPPCPPGWPCLVSPRANMAYRYRLIDFDNSTKTNRPLHVFHAYYLQYVNRLLDGLPLGYVIEPWEF